jgi:hypothetical protein
MGTTDPCPAVGKRHGSRRPIAETHLTERSYVRLNVTNTTVQDSLGPGDPRKVPLDPGDPPKGVLKGITLKYIESRVFSHHTLPHCWV